MADILETFDFDDAPGLKKLKNLEDRLLKAQERAEDLGDAQKKAFEDGAKRAANFDKGLIVAGKTINGTIRLIKRLGVASTVAFGAATAAALKLSERNQALTEEQEKVRSAWDKFTFDLSKKFGPAIFAVQETIITLLGTASDKVGGLSNDFATGLGASIIAAGKVAKTFFDEFGKRAEKIRLQLAKFDLQAQRALTIDPNERQGLQAAINVLDGLIEKQTSDITDLGDLYQKTYTEAKERLDAMVESGKFNNENLEDEIKALQKLREEYDKITRQIKERIQGLQVENAEGLERINLAEKFASEEIDRLEKSAQALATTEAQKKELEDLFYRLRTESAERFEQERTNFLVEEEKKRREAILKSNQQLFSDLDQLDTGVFDSQGRLSTENPNEFNFDNDLASVIAGQNLRLQEQIGKNRNFLEEWKRDVLATLGINEDEAAFILDNFGQLLNGLGDLFTAGIDRNLEENQRYIDDIQNRTDQVQQELNRELELQRVGRENNVASKRRELEELQKEEQKAQKEQERLEKQRLRAQLLQDTVQQASSLATAAAEIFKSTGKFGPVGIGLAIGLIGTMFSLMARYRAQARESANQSDVRLYKGGGIQDSGWVNYRNGRSDVPGRGRGHRVEDSNLILGGREMVVAEGPAGSQDPRFWKIINDGRANHLDLYDLITRGPDVKEINNSFSEQKKVYTNHMVQQRRKDQKDAFKEVMKEHSREIINYFKKEFPHYITKQSDTTEIVKKTGTEEIRTKITDD